jgi:hypothetical protein
MKRIVLLVTVALVMALMMTVAGPALATVHPQSKAECAESDFAADQHPPGISGGSNADNEAAPIEAQLDNSTTNDFHAWKSEECPAPDK